MTSSLPARIGAERSRCERSIFTLKPVHAYRDDSVCLQFLHLWLGSRQGVPLDTYGDAFGVVDVKKSAANRSAKLTAEYRSSRTSFWTDHEDGTVSSESARSWMSHCIYAHDNIDADFFLNILLRFHISHEFWDTGRPLEPRESLNVCLLKGHRYHNRWKLGTARLTTMDAQFVTGCQADCLRSR
jgi:hypothetical protein